MPINGQSVTFNDLSISNLSTVLDTNYNVSSVIVTTPSGPVSIGGTNTLTLGSGIDLSAASQNLTITSPVAMGGNQTWNVAGGQTMSVNGGVSDNGAGNALTLTGSGMVSLGGATTYNGVTTINTNCSLQMSASNVLPNGTNAASNVGDITNNGTLDLNGTAQAVNGLNGSGVVDNTGGGAAILTIGVNNDGGTFTGFIQDTSGNLTLVKNGSGTEALKGTNTYSGGTIVNSGFISFYTPAAFGSGPVTVNSGSTILGAGNFAFTNPVTLNSGTMRVGGGASHTLTNTALVTVTGNSVIQADGGTVNINLLGGLDMGSSGSTLTNSGSANTTIISGPLTGSSGTIFVTLTETLFLSGSNSFAGTFRTPTGTLTIQNVNALRNATLDMNAADTGSVNLNNNNSIMGAITGSRNLSIGSGAVSIGNNNTSTTYSGVLSGSGSLTKIGTGTLTLSGPNTYTGKTTASAGTLTLSGSGSLASTNFTVASGATLDVSGESSQFTLGISSTLTNSAVGAVLSGSNNCSVGTLSVVTDGVNPSFFQTNGTMTISASTVIRVNNTGAALTSGTHPLIAVATAGKLGKVTGVLPAVAVTGNGAVGTVSLQINGTGGLDLVVTGGTPPHAVITGVTLSGGNLILQGTNGAASGTYSILNATNVALPLASWTTNSTGTFTAGGAFSNAVPISTQVVQRFFLIKQP